MHGSEDTIISFGLTSYKVLYFSKPSATQSISGNLEDENFEKAEDPGNSYRTASNETSLISEVSHLLNENNFILVPKQNKISLSNLSDDHREK